MTLYKKDRTGLIYGRWTVISFSHIHFEPTGERVPYWNCKCICGTERPVNGSNLQKLLSTSCGCYNKEIVSNRISPVLRPYAEASRHQLYLSYRRGAKSRNHIFNLTEEEFSILTSQNCIYCNTEPSSINKIARLNGSYIYNGIDRVDNTKGYELSNCVTCCKTCNISKRQMTVKEWKEWLLKVVKNLKLV